MKLQVLEFETENGTLVRMTLKEAEDLHAQLEELFGVKVQQHPYTPSTGPTTPLTHPYTWCVADDHTSSCTMGTNHIVS